MDGLVRELTAAYLDQHGKLLSTTISPVPPASDPARLYAFYRDSNPYSIAADVRHGLESSSDLQQLSIAEITVWQEVYAAYHRFVGVLLSAQESISTAGASGWSSVYEEWKKVVNGLLNAYQKDLLAAWTIPCLYVAAKYLRVFAIKADDHAASQMDGVRPVGAGLDEGDGSASGAKHEKLEDAARQLNRIFGLCISDRAPIAESRKWGLYYITNLLFKTYFRLDRISSCRTILRSIQSPTTDMPPMSAFPRSHQVTFNYYVGLIHFLEQRYEQAQTHLSDSYTLCYVQSEKNTRLILMYLLPCKMLNEQRLPTKELLEPYPTLDALFSPICACIRAADLAGFHMAMQEGEREFVKRRIYLTLERARDILLRNIFRKVFVSGPTAEPVKEGDAPERRTRIPVDEFVAALQLAGPPGDNGSSRIDNSEAECLIASLIHKGYMKGYISRIHGMVVLSKKGDAFPGTGV